MRGRGRGVTRSVGDRRVSGNSTRAAVKALDNSDHNGVKLRPAVEVTAEISTDKRSAPSRPHRVVTTVTEDGTELPKKLNTKVFIDGLPYENEVKSSSRSVEEELMQFAIAWKVGKPLRLIKKEGQGFGFLAFQSPHSVDVAVRVLNGRKFLGRSLRVEVPKPRDMEGAGGGMHGAYDPGKSSYTRQVLLSDLAKVAQPEIIREILRDVAPQLEKQLDSIKMTSKNRKAFLTFKSSEDVEAAVQFLDGLSMFGRRISAAQAAAPGSLPYSKVSIRSAAPGAAEGALVARNHLASGDHVNVEAVEDVVVPLGLEVAAGKRPAKGPGKRTSDTTVVTKSETLPSNITGVTEKYNLLDSGPAEVFVGNLGENITEQELRAHFSVCGKINSCKIIVNKNTMLPTGIASIVFALPAYAAYAQKHLHGSHLRGHVLRVDRGEEASAPLVSELQPPDDEDVIDEDGYMEHFGITDKREYFKGTSFEEKASRGKKRTRSNDNGDATISGKAKSSRGDKPRGARLAKPPVKSSTIVDSGDDDDEEEHFFDVDEGNGVQARFGVKHSNNKRKGAPASLRKAIKSKEKRKRSL